MQKVLHHVVTPLNVSLKHTRNFLLLREIANLLQKTFFDEVKIMKALKIIRTIFGIALLVCGRRRWWMEIVIVV